MLLTRSRLCPRPKPGSSLHLHVLGTPPAFVLSQDQTLREELLKRANTSHTLTKSRQGNYNSRATRRGRWRTSKTLGLSLVGSDPCAHSRKSTYTMDSGAQDGVNLGTASRKTRRTGQSSDGVEPGHTSRSRGRPSCAHAVEFSKTVAPLQEGCSFFRGAPGSRIRIPGCGLVSIAPGLGSWAPSQSEPPGGVIRRQAAPRPRDPRSSP